MTRDNQDPGFNVNTGWGPGLGDLVGKEQPRYVHTTDEGTHSWCRRRVGGPGLDGPTGNLVVWNRMTFLT